MSNTPFSKFKPVFILTLLLSSGLTACGDDSNSEDKSDQCSDELKAYCEKDGLICAEGDCVDALCQNKTCEEADQVCHLGNCIFEICKDKKCSLGHACNAAGKCYTTGGANVLLVLENNNNQVCDDNSCNVTAGLSLSAEPAYPVRLTLSLAGDGASDAELDQVELVFNPSDWNTIQYITVRGIEDQIADQDKPFTLTVVSQSDDDSFDHLTLTKDLVSIDTDEPKLLIETPDGLKTSEDGDSVDIKIRLTIKPESNVTVPFLLDPPDYSEISTDALIFTPDDWDQWQTLTITGLDDGDTVNTSAHYYHLNIDKIRSEDARYSEMDIPLPIRLENLDNDNKGRPSIYVSPSQFVVSESGTTDTLYVTLSSSPTMSTRIKAKVEPSDECVIVSENILFFDDKNYNVEQPIEIAGVDDNEPDGDVWCTLTLEGDSDDMNLGTSYKNVYAFISGTNNDNEKASINLVQPIENLSENGMVNNAPASTRACFNLGVQPRSDVTLNFLSSDTQTGFNVSPQTLTIHSDDYDKTDHCVTLTAVDDGEIDGTILSTLHLTSDSTDERFLNLSNDYTISVYDRNALQIILDASQFPSSVVENDTTHYQIKAKLGYKPESNYSVQATCRDDRNQDCTNKYIKITQAKQTATKDAWNDWLIFDIAPIDNAVVDNERNLKINFETSALPRSPSTTSSQFTITDDEQPGINLSCYVTSPYLKASTLPSGQYNRNTDEEGQMICTVSLTQPPSETVEIELTSRSDVIKLRFGKVTFSPSKLEPVEVKKALEYVTDSVPYTNAYDRVYIDAVSNTPSYGAKKVTSAPMYHYTVGHYYYFGYNGDTTNGFHHDGHGQFATLPLGYYGLRAWGASSGLPYSESGNGNIYKMNQIRANGTYKCKNPGGYGQYVSGTLHLSERQSIYVYVGGAGTTYTGDNSTRNNPLRAGYNGGSAGSTGASGNRGVGGGGATDFCLDSDSYFHCSSINVHYPYRILVAGGGGGAALRDCTDGTRYGGVADWYDSRSIYGHGPLLSHNFLEQRKLRTHNGFRHLGHEIIVKNFV